MRISTGKVDNETVLLLQEIYCNTVLETAEGNRVAICMRDDTIEFNIIKLNKWCRINMSTGDISPGYIEKRISSPRFSGPNDIGSCRQCDRRGLPLGYSCPMRAN